MKKNLWCAFPVIFTAMARKAQFYNSITHNEAIMKTYLFFLLSLLAATGNLFAQADLFYVSPGAVLTARPGALIALNNINFKTDGTVNADSAAILLNGDQTTYIGGLQQPAIGTLQINKTAGQANLNGNILVNTAVIFTNGLIDLNNQTLTLSQTGNLQNEDENSRITGINTGKVYTTRTGVNSPNHFNAGNLGADITSSANLDNLEITRNHLPVTVNGKQGIQRSFLIDPKNNSSLNATLRFYYFDAELNGKNESTLVLWKSPDNITWTYIGADTRDDAANYVEKTGLADLSWWTLTDAASPLPLNLISFGAVCKNNFVQLQWQTGNEQNVQNIIVERSANGTIWKNIQTLTARDASTNGAAYSYNDNDPQASAFYRLKITDKDGKFSYSPVFSGGCADVTMPFAVYPNPAATQATARVGVRKKTEAILSIIGSNGAIIYKQIWQLNTGNNFLQLPITNLSAGTYSIHVKIEGNNLYKQFTKQ